jgi:Trk-type K+ transport system membrane component
MLAIGTVLAALLLSLLITRIATIALSVTGLSRETARFQARSAFTGVGFTTDLLGQMALESHGRGAVDPQQWSRARARK